MAQGRPEAPDGAFAPEEPELATAPDTGADWAALGARAIEAPSGWRVPSWIGRAAEAAGQALPSRQLEFALDATTHQRRSAARGAWTSPEWREARGPDQWLSAHPCATIEEVTP